VRKENIVRIAALIGLCALVYYFSFDQGRRNLEPKIKRLETALEAKERLNQSLALEISRLKEELKKAQTLYPSAASEAGWSAEEESDRITVRLRSSRILFDQRLVLTCLAIDRTAKQADLQINLIQEEKLIQEKVKLGQGLRFSLNGREFILILDEIHSSFVTTQIIPK